MYLMTFSAVECFTALQAARRRAEAKKLAELTGTDMYTVDIAVPAEFLDVDATIEHTKGHLGHNPHSHAYSSQKQHGLHADAHQHAHDLGHGHSL